MDRRPNVVVCICDQLRPFEVGCYGNRIIRTPHIDQLAQEGVRFEQAVTNNPVCMPARSSLISGQYSRTCTGILTNYAERGVEGKSTLPEYPVSERAHLPDITLAECFRELGYDTALFGKWHIHPAPRLLGFDYSLFPRVHHRHTGQIFVENTGLGEVVEGFSVEFEAERVSRYLGERGERPFFMLYSISPPHMPLADAPARYLNMYAPDEVPLRPNVYVDGELAWDEEWFKIYLWDFLYYQEKVPHTTVLPEGFGLRQLTSLYYGMTSWVDDMVGRLMAGLEANGLADDTIVVFLSDHGDNLGSHHLFNKGRLIEESIRIPLIFRAPGQCEPRVNTAQIAGIIDVMPTLLELCGAEIPAAVQGRSLAPLLAGEGDELEDNAAFIETSIGQVGVRTPTHLYGMQLAEDLRTIVDDGTCLFDLEADPYERVNLARTGHASELATRLRQQVEEWNRATPWLG